MPDALLAASTMDPLSIATGAAGLAVFAGSVAKLIYGAVQKCEDVDKDVEVLAKEIQSLSTSLLSVEKGMKSPAFVSSVSQVAPGDESRKRLDYIHTVLEDCERTLKDLEALISAVRSGKEAPRSMSWKPAMALKLHLETPALSRLRKQLSDYRSIIQMEAQVLDL